MAAAFLQPPRRRSLDWPLVPAARSRPIRDPHRRGGADPSARRPLRRRRRRSWGPRLAIVAVLALLVGGAFAALAYAASSTADRTPDGASVGGVAIGGLTREKALAKLTHAIGKPARRPVRVTVRGESLKLSAHGAHVRLDLAEAVDRALTAGREGSFVERGWRAISGGQVASSQPVHVSVSRQAVRAFVDRLVERVAEPAVDAQLSISVTDVGVTPSADGRRLADRAQLERRIVRKFRDPGAGRRIKASTEVVEPSVTADQVWDQTPTVVTVAHDSRTVRVFDRGEVAKTYKVAVGQPEYPTPMGQFSVQVMQKDPPWNVPNSEWAGDLAGQTIPGGDPGNPLKARWVGFSGSVGFHGTSDAGSLGSAASHGCVRMNVADVKDLFERVSVGTPVLVGA